MGLREAWWPMCRGSSAAGEMQACPLLAVIRARRFDRGPHKCVMGRQTLGNPTSKCLVRGRVDLRRTKEKWPNEAVRNQKRKYGKERRKEPPGKEE